MKYSLYTLLFLSLFAACKNDKKEEQSVAPLNNNPVPAVLNYNITNVYPHSIDAFTEGLEWHDNALYEGTGDPDYKGVSKLAKIDLATGKDLQKIGLSNEFFGEGITILNGKLYQLTYKEGKCFVYDAKTFKKIKEFGYSGEGWGMTNDGKYLIMDDGSNNIYYRDPETFAVVKAVGVSDNNGPLASINELEYVDGYIYANVYTTNYIVKIDPKTGNVVSRADFSGILDKYAPGQLPEQQQRSEGAVLNGIAYDSVGKRFFVTGKLWPKLFELKFN
ncbi:MAG: glutaminyl-peptide cyclotransferase [Chitinophagaceae bacterium]|nr:glutaminyl-peptide cyclotransferase [Chitinophagaceae bacterium]